MLNLFLFALPVLFLTIFLIKWFCATNYRYHLPPSPPRLPILGNLHQLGTRPYRSLEKLAQQYGELMTLHFGFKPVIVVSSADVAREIMKTNDVLFCTKAKSTVCDKLLYGSRDVGAAPYGEYWKQMKSICVLQLLSSKRVRSFQGIREEELAMLIQNVQQLSTLSQPVNLSELFSVFTHDVICRVALGDKFSGCNESAIKLRKLVGEFTALIGTFPVGDFIPWLYWVSHLTGLDARTERVSKEFDEFLETIVDEHMVNLSTERNMDLDEDKKDFVDILLQAERDKNSSCVSIDRDSIKAIILDIFIGGTDTTSTVVEWAMTELIRHPKAMKRLQDEVAGATNGKQVITEIELDKMSYLKAVIKETMRLYPPVPLRGRESMQDVKIKGYDLPKGTMVLVNTWSIGRDHTLWDEPEKFHPERFVNSSVDFKGHDFQLIPFGAGRRGCPGVLFATAIIELVLANLVHKFDWTLPDGVRDQDMVIRECGGIVIRREDPLMAIAVPRSC